MTWKLPLAVILAGCGVWLLAGRLTLAQDTLDTELATQRFKVEMRKQAAQLAALRGSKGQIPDDNALCLLCHVNFTEELLVTEHLDEGISCAYCHGISYEHMDDETSQTRPDLLYGRAQVAPMCEKCHGPHRDPDKVQEFLEEWKGSARPNGRPILAQAMCTDCHGTHVIPRAGAVINPEPGRGE